MNRAITLVNITALIIGISYGLHNPIVPIFAKNEIGATYIELGIIGMANFIPYMFIPLFVGILLDRYHNGRLLSLGVVINSAAVFLLSLAKTVPEVMILRAMTGIAHAFFWPPSESIISNSSPKESRVKNIGKFTGFFIGGFMIGPLIGTFLLEGLDVSFRMLFEISTYVMAAAIIFSIRIKDDSHQKHFKFSFSAVKEMTRFPHIIVILIFCSSSFGMILTIYPAYLNDSGMSATQIEILYFAFGISRIITLASTDRLARRTTGTLIASTLSIAAGLLISFYSQSIFEFAAAMFMMGFGFSIIFPLTLEVILQRTPKEITGKIIGAYETTFGIGWASGPLIAGLISEFSGNAMPYMAFFVVGIGVSILSIIKKHTLEPVSKQ